MSIKTNINQKDGLYFITFTCFKWINLFEISDGYDVVYNWFDILTKNGSYVCGYVIMPNHIHALIAFTNTKNKSINTIVGNGKRFMAYEIIKKLKAKNELNLLHKLEINTTIAQKSKGQIHQVFEPSFDWKECISDDFTEIKLNYIHNNPVSNKWNLVASPPPLAQVFVIL